MSSPSSDKVDANLDPQKASSTSENIRGYVGRHGAGGMTTTAGRLNTEAEVRERRKEAMDGQPRVPGMIRDEEPPASFRKKGDPFTIKLTSTAESLRSYPGATNFFQA